MVAEKYSLEDFLVPEKVVAYVDSVGLRDAFSPSLEDSLHPKEAPNRMHAVDKNNLHPYPPKWDDLARLHWLTRVREVVSAVEFGAGFSTAVIAHALDMNALAMGTWADTHRRVEFPFTLLSIDQSQYWLDLSLGRVTPALQSRVRTHCSTVGMGTFGDRVCTYFESLPNFVADLVLLDGPDQYATETAVRGFNTGNVGLMPMAADLLAVEHFFEPGSVIVIDGRTANARFLRANFQRNWSYFHSTSGQFHIFELSEGALGPINESRLKRIGPLIETTL